MEIAEKAARNFLPGGLAVGSWPDVESFFQQLNERDLPDARALEDWLMDWSELEAAIDEEAAWRYIRMTCDTRDKEAAARYRSFVTDVLPKVEEWKDRLNRKLVASPFADGLKGPGY